MVSGAFSASTGGLLAVGGTGTTPRGAGVSSSCLPFHHCLDMKERRAAHLRCQIGSTALAQFAQLIEFTLADKVILPLAFNHLLERLLAERTVGSTGIQLIQIGPVGRRITDEHGHFGQQTGAIVFGGHA